MLTNMFEKLRSTEVQLIGSWYQAHGKVIEDEVSSRISFLTQEYLVRIGADSSGWTTLFQDSQDGRYWELTFPHSDWHGGGPPTLTYVSEIDVKRKYADLLKER